LQADEEIMWDGLCCVELSQGCKGDHHIELVECLRRQNHRIPGLMTVSFIFRQEYMGQLGGMSFFQSHPDWETKPVMGLLSQHAKQMYGESTA
jgi:hypothetical protein